MLTEDTIHAEVDYYIENFVEEFNSESEREDVLERIHELTEDMWGQLVGHGRIDKNYPLDQLIEKLPAVSAILKYAEEHAWVADDSGLWEGLTYGIVPSMAYFSLENIVYAALEGMGIDTNDEFPFHNYLAGVDDE